MQMSMIRLSAVALTLALPAGRGTAVPPVHASPRAAVDTAVFAGGCFWGVEAVFEHIKGVKSAVSGYSGGSTTSPSYEEVSTGTTGHAESVQVVYDPSKVSYAQLLEVFFSVAHDPTQLNRQGPDHGTQYRSAIFFRTAEQQQTAQRYIAQLQAKKVFRSPIVTTVVPLGRFYPAESYHQGYLEKHPDQPYIVINDAPKLVALEQEFPALYKSGGEGTR